MLKPARIPKPSEVEIRPVLSVDDFGGEFTPELREQEASVRAQTLGLGAVRFQTGPELSIAGLSDSYDAQSRRDIPAQSGRFAPHIGRVPGQIGMTTFGVFDPQSGFGSVEIWIPREK